MDEKIYDALVSLRGAIEKHSALQEQANDLMRRLNATLEQAAQVTFDLGEIVKGEDAKDDRGQSAARV